MQNTKFCADISLRDEKIGCLEHPPARKIDTRLRVISNLAHVQTIFVARRAARHKTRLPLAASARYTLFGPPVFDDKRAAVGVLAESSTLCARTAEDEDTSAPAR